jgi:hypothetical protein
MLGLQINQGKTKYDSGMEKQIKTKYNRTIKNKKIIHLKKLKILILVLYLMKIKITKHNYKTELKILTKHTLCYKHF